MPESTRQLPLPRVPAGQALGAIEKSMLRDGYEMVVDLDASSGCRIVDKVSGRSYLDFFNYFATAPVGHNHPALTDPAFVAEIGRVALHNPSNADFYTSEMAGFVDTLRRTAQPDSLPHLFMVAGGALAVENAMKTAFDWKFQKRRERGLPDDENLKVLHFEKAFHGRSGYTMSVTNTEPGKVKWFPKFDWPRVSTPAIRFPLADHEAAVEEAEGRSLAEIRAALEKDGDHIAAILIEPIQGEGGDNHFRPQFMQALRKICDENECLLILDEVQTGVGTTGKWWGYQHHGIEPDVLCFGKRMQVCGILASRRVDEVDSVFQVSSRINSTWGGNLVDMVRGARFLQVIEEEGLVANAAAMGDYFLERLHALGEGLGGMFDNIRGQGLFVAFTLPSRELRDEALERSEEEGLLVLPSGPESIRFRPPLNVRREDIDEACEILGRVFRRAG